MEVLAGVASGMAVVSLSIQLIDSIGKIKTFAHNVKDASKELERLVDLLERLEAMLEDVRKLMERQSSLQAHHFPMPSNTILRCLKSCEKTLQPLHVIIEKYAVPKPHGSTGVTRFKNGLRIGLKAKDIDGFETSIEREINFLHNTLGANSSAILMQVFPVILENQKAAGAFYQSSVAVQNSVDVTAVTSSYQDHATSAGTVSTYVTMEVTPIKSPLEMIGIRQHKNTRRVRFSSGCAVTGCRKEVVSEEHEFFLAWRLAGYGLTWNLQRSYGNVMPSLRVFPIVSHFSPEVTSLMKDGDVGSFQQLLSDGVIHPFSRRPDGYSLLHLAAEYHRIDICQLLRHLGVKSELTVYNESPLSVATVWGTSGENSRLVDIWRHFFNEDHIIGAFKDEHWLWDFESAYSTLEAQWICQESARLLSAEDSIGIYGHIVRSLWFEIIFNHQRHDTPVVELPELSLTMEAQNQIENGHFQLVRTIFDDCSSTGSSFILGGALVRWLSQSGMDVDGCISQELYRYPGHILRGGPFPNRKIIFEACEERGWVLGFEWTFDRDEPGYLLVSEYQGLFVKSYFELDEWPFDKPKIEYWEPEYDHEEARRNERFSRRMAAKARKERARTGQKMSRSRMPGSWVW